MTPSSGGRFEVFYDGSADFREVETETARRSPAKSFALLEARRGAERLSARMRIAISTGGGDAPGLNAVIRAAVLSAINRGWDVLGIKRGFAGLMGEDEVIPLTRDSVRGIAHLGGTILRTTNRGNPFHYPRVQPDGTIVEEDRSDELIENARAARDRRASSRSAATARWPSRSCSATRE